MQGDAITNKAVVPFLTNKQKKKGFNGVDGHLRLVGATGMRGLARHLEEQLPYEKRSKTCVESIEVGPGKFNVSLPDGKVIADYVVLTCPVPQSLSLVKGMNLADVDQLSAIKYDKTLSFQLQFRRGAVVPKLGEYGGLQKPCSSIHFVASNRAKG